MGDGVKTALSEAVAAHREGNGAASQQGELFALPASRRTELDEAVAAAQSDAAIVDEAWHQAQQERDPARRGRKQGTRNMRTEEAARYYVRRHGDPLEQAVKLGAIPILAKGVLEALAQRLACTKLEAAKFWASNNQAVMPYLRPRLSSVALQPVGSPESAEAVLWQDWNYIDGELVDGGVNDATAIEAQETAGELEDQREPTP